VESRIKMHLDSLVQQEVMVLAGIDGMELRIRFNKGETIHTEIATNSTLQRSTKCLLPRDSPS
jgi:uncharacterized SAM-dependent methyltransferase